ncbi:hypothetical protein D3C87_1339230 [compost metagenome]
MKTLAGDPHANLRHGSNERFGSNGRNQKSSKAVSMFAETEATHRTDLDSHVKEPNSHGLLQESIYKG